MLDDICTFTEAVEPCEREYKHAFPKSIEASIRTRKDIVCTILNFPTDGQMTKFSDIFNHGALKSIAWVSLLGNRNIK